MPRVPVSTSKELPATELVVINSSIPRGFGPNPRVFRRRNGVYILPRSPQSPTLDIRRVPKPAAVVESRKGRRANDYTSIKAAELVIDAFQPGILLPPLEKESSTSSQCWSPTFPDICVKGMNLYKVPVFDPAENHISSFSQLHKLDTFPALGLEEDEFWKLFSKCAVCLNFMTTRTVPYHICPSNDNLRGRCKLLKDSPLISANWHESVVELFPADSKYRALALNLQRYEQALAGSSTFEHRGLRLVLGDTMIDPKEIPLSEKLVSDLADTVSAHLAVYRVLELEVHRIGKRPTSPAPSRPKSLTSGMIKGIQVPKLWTKLKSWKDVLLDFKSDVDNISPTTQARIHHINSNVQGSLYHLQGLADSDLNAKVTNEMHNFRIAAFHYSLIKETASSSTAILPGIPQGSGTSLQMSDLTDDQSIWDKYNPNTQNKITSFLKRYKRSELRLPLHASLIVSPLILLMNINVSKSHFRRPSVYQLSYALGNMKPEILKRVEEVIWETLWEVNEDSLLLSVIDSFKKLVASEAFTDALALPSDDPAFSFFEPFDELSGTNNVPPSTAVPGVDIADASSLSCASTLVHRVYPPLNFQQLHYQDRNVDGGSETNIQTTASHCIWR
ncbi:hypothetical protein BDN70DRAFT_937346 [Pholiota conissans]|uniref:Uncharacterized protein n=1 Tax=Pholiota conissans TaxID=109636 RepID=A0A9P5YTL5_9AGAR|nr:hypothetical protein BDN70DRAFT_937346 [Pholiota conissans]